MEKPRLCGCLLDDHDPIAHELVGSAHQLDRVLSAVLNVGGARPDRRTCVVQPEQVVVIRGAAHAIRPVQARRKPSHGCDDIEILTTEVVETTRRHGGAGRASIDEIAFPRAGRAIGQISIVCCR